MSADTTTQRNIVFYGRVSTEHEAQLSALENQMQWYDDQLKMHPNWKLINKYIDKGITGTQAKKRPAFLQMIADAKKHDFDLIVTREVCRFARNTVDTLVYTRELKAEGIEVFFANDNIWTLDNDGELRLTIMATLAQDESRKISERSRAGQYISRQNGVLYGTGNILGYTRVGDHYEIEPEQAEIVRKIFTLYNDGMGYQKIRDTLRELGLKRASGDSNWDIRAIERIITNETYTGKVPYNKSSKADFLQPRVANNDIETHVYVPSDKVPAIISDEIFQEAQKNREARTRWNGDHKAPKKQRLDTWTQRLVCSCGSHFRKDTWHKNKTKADSFGYVCYGRISRGKNYCSMPSVPEWKLEMMSKEVIQLVWIERKEAALLAYKWISKAAEQVNNTDELKNKIQKLEHRLENYAAMRADGELSREEYQAFKRKTEEELTELRNQIVDSPVDMKQIQEVLDKAIDFSQPTLPKTVIETFVYKIQVVDKDHFVFYIGLNQNGSLMKDYCNAPVSFNVTTTGRGFKTCKCTVQKDDENTDSDLSEGDQSSSLPSMDGGAEVSCLNKNRECLCSYTGKIDNNRCVSMYSCPGGYKVWQGDFVTVQPVILDNKCFFTSQIASFEISKDKAKLFKNDVKRFYPVTVDVFVL